MNRRGFMKLLALTPLAGLLKPEPKIRKTIQGQSADVVMVVGEPAIVWDGGIWVDPTKWEKDRFVGKLTGIYNPLKKS